MRATTRSACVDRSLGAIQDHYDSHSGVRAAAFFAGLGCTCAQLSINVLLNSVSTGMDMAGLWPKYINIRRGAYILAAVSCHRCHVRVKLLTSSAVSRPTLGRFSLLPALS